MTAQPLVLQDPVSNVSPLRPRSVAPPVARRRAARSHAAFLAEASKRLAGSLDLQLTVDCLADLSIPGLGDACVVYLFKDRSPAGTLASARHVDPNRLSRLLPLVHAAFAEPRGLRPLLAATASGLPTVLSTRQAMALLADGADSPAVFSELAIGSALLVPVVEGHHTRAIAMFLTRHRRHFTPHRVRLAKELVGRFALALEAALLYEACTETLKDVQYSLATTIHDVMSPLTFIKGSTQRLERLDPATTDPAAAASELATRLAAIDAAANRMAAALTTLLDSTSPVPPVVVGEPHEATDLVRVAQRAIATEQLMAQNHAIRLLHAPCRLLGNWKPEHVERILANLIGNSVKYSPPCSSVDVTVGTTDDADGRWAVIRVVDNGVGIPAQDLPFVFEPFRRGANVGSAAGSGLGLASVWQLVTSYNGRVSIDSDLGSGTSVTVRLPIPD